MPDVLGIRSFALALDGTVHDSAGRRGLEEMIDGLSKGRSMDRVCRTATALGTAALEGAESLDRPSCGVFFGSGYGTYPSNLDHLKTLRAGEPPSPAVFSQTQPNIPAAWISISLGLAGPMLTQVDGGLGGSGALLSAFMFLSQGLATDLLAGSVSTADDRVAAALGTAVPSIAKRGLAEGGGFLLLTRTDGAPRLADLVLAKAVRVCEGGAVDAVREAWALGGWDLVCACREGLDRARPPRDEARFVCLGDWGGELAEAAGPAAVAAAVQAVHTGCLGERKLDARPRRVLVADTGLCGQDVFLFGVKESHGA